MSSTKSLFNTHIPPLSDRMRPKTIEDFIGQGHLVGDGKLVSRLVESRQLVSLIFWGPPGTGKTTLARILAHSMGAFIAELSAVSSGVKDLREVIRTAVTKQDLGIQTILFIDEIHRFSKSQQDALLHAVEDGTLYLIGATTENPSFEVISPLLSRCRVLVLKALTEAALNTILTRTMKEDIIFRSHPVDLPETSRQLLIQSSGGDARKMLNTLELAMKLSLNQERISEETVREALQDTTRIYDKTGDYHYDTISAFIKSIRGSDPDAAIYWLAVMLEGGEKPEFIARRLIILASEDIGNADPQALPLAVSGFQAVHRIGMPEAAIILAQVTTYLAAVPKSNASYMAIKSAQSRIQSAGTPGVPLHLRNAPTSLMKSLDYGKGYRYPHDHPDHFIRESYFPEGQEQRFYQPDGSGREAYLLERLQKIWPERFGSDKE
ncbi:MAG: replication-associated recombination protein A [FCB group bacterium]|nr:replication-associated recombination protein A [FCB group bacterium]